MRGREDLRSGPFTCTTDQSTNLGMCLSTSTKQSSQSLSVSCLETQNSHFLYVTSSEIRNRLCLFYYYFYEEGLLRALAKLGEYWESGLKVA